MNTGYWTRGPGNGLGTGGWHYLFKAVESVKTARGFRPGLDLLTGAGSYIVVAPSLHASGGHYEWTDEPHPESCARDTIALVVPPQWLLDAACTGPARRNPESGARTTERVPVERLLSAAVDKVNDGAGRNDTGLEFFTQLRDNGYSRDESGLALRDWVEPRTQPHRARIATPKGKPKQPCEAPTADPRVNRGRNRPVTD